MNQRRAKFFEKLTNMGVFPIFGDVNNEMLDKVQKCFSEFYLKKLEDITVIIYSNGGNTEVCLEIYDLIKLYPGKKTGIVIGKAKSAAAIILQACDKRLAIPHSKILIHNGSSNFKNDLLYDKDKLMEFISILRKTRKFIIDIFSQRTKKTDEEILALCMEDRDMTTKEALDFGLIDEIFTGQLPFDLSKLSTIVDDQK